MPIRLSDHQQQLLDILRANGGWMRRSDLAHALGKDVLSLDDIQQLDLLGDSGLLIRETSDDLGSQGETVRYRYTEPKAEL